VQEFLVHILDRYGAFLSEASDELRAVRRVPTATFGISLMHQTTCSVVQARQHAPRAGDHARRQCVQVAQAESSPSLSSSSS
jgi:hypothetical protein